MTFGCDKFVNTFHNVLHKRLIDNQTMPCQNFARWRSQSKYDLGFVPLSEFVVPVNACGFYHKIDCPIELHRTVKQSGKFDYLGLRIPLESQLKVNEWKKHLQNYWDTQLIDLIKNGFPLDFNRDSPLKWDDKNRTSALQNPEHVDTYVREEIGFKAIILILIALL